MTEREIDLKGKKLEEPESSRDSYLLQPHDLLDIENDLVPKHKNKIDNNFMTELIGVLIFIGAPIITLAIIFWWSWLLIAAAGK